MKKILSICLCALILLPLFSSCSKPPEYSEIEARFIELVEASGEVNMIFFGEGLQTYERIYDPKSSTEVIVEEQTAEDGTAKKVYHYYYQIPDETYGTVFAYRKSYLDDYKYLEVLSEPRSEKTAFYEDAEKNIFAYEIEGYVEPVYEFYYDSEDMTDYDYVRDDEKYTSVAEIKALAEKVYSSEYLNSLYSSMFVGYVSADSSVSGLSARYMEYADDDGNVRLMKSNEFDPFITEVRKYDFSTAKIIRPANAEYVTIEVDSYLPSNPDARLTVELSMILQNGVWMLDSATY